MGRRSYGRRRRYGRRSRRPNAARATVRGTFAPRHQYLKLKAAFQHYIASEAQNSRTLQIRLDNPYQPIQFDANWTRTGSVDPLGWNAYANLFQRYVVHGVKVQARCYYISGSPNVTSVQTPWDWCVSTDATSAPPVGEIRSMPISGSLLPSTERPSILKKYFNLNRIMGVTVAKHDRFYKEWGDLTAGHAYLRIAALSSTYANTQVDWTITWYISAVSSNAVAGDPAAAMALRQFTTPYTGGELNEPDAAAIQQAVNTGFTTNPRALALANLGGHKRSLSTDQ